MAGRAGARLAAQLGFGAGRMTLIRGVMALPDPCFSTPRVPGAAPPMLCRSPTAFTCGRDYAPMQGSSPMAPFLGASSRLAGSAVPLHVTGFAPETVS